MARLWLNRPSTAPYRLGPIFLGLRPHNRLSEMTIMVQQAVAIDIDNSQLSSYMEIRTIIIKVILMHGKSHYVSRGGWAHLGSRAESRTICQPDPINSNLIDGQDGRSRVASYPSCSCVRADSYLAPCREQLSERAALASWLGLAKPVPSSP